jgi:hypothetical protein
MFVFDINVAVHFAICSLPLGILEKAEIFGIMQLLDEIVNKVSVPVNREWTVSQTRRVESNPINQPSHTYSTRTNKQDINCTRIAEGIEKIIKEKSTILQQSTSISVRSHRDTRPQRRAAVRVHTGKIRSQAPDEPAVSV